MMNLLRFEWKKMWKQKKLLLMLFVVMISVLAIYFTIDLSVKPKQERAIAQMGTVISHADQIYSALYEKELTGVITDDEIEQFDLINQMATALFHRNSSIYKEQWEKIPLHEKDIFTYLQAYEQAGGQFSVLTPLQKEQLIQKNDWMIAYDVAYEDELYPSSPALLTKKNVDLLFSVAGVFLLLLLFGNTMTKEKELQTWRTLQSQPISIQKIILTKYLINFISVLTFILTVLIISLFLSLTYSDYPLNFNYPIMITSGEAFSFISTTEYLLRLILLFIGATAFAFSVALFISKFIQNSFGAIVMTGVLLSIGIFVTDTFSLLQMPFNPFRVFQFENILVELLEHSSFLPVLSAIIWSAVILVLTIKMPDKVVKLLNKREDYSFFRNGKTASHRSAVWTIIVFEWRKVKRNILLKQLFVMLSLFAIIGYFVLQAQAEKRQDDYFESLQAILYNTEHEWIPSQKQSLEEIQQLLQEAIDEDDKFLMALYEEDAQRIEQMIQDDIENNALLASTIESFENGDFLPLYNYQLKQNQRYLMFDNTQEISKFTIEANIKEKEWLIEHKIQPVFIGDFQTTIYDYFSDQDLEARKYYEDAYDKIDHSALFSLYIYFKNYFYIILLVLLLVLFGAGYANEKGKKRTWDFLKTEPIEERKMILGKSSFSIILATMSSLALFAFIILFTTIFNRFGDWKYPVLHYDSKKYIDTLETYEGIRKFEGAGHFIYLGDYLMSSFGLFFSILLFLMSLSILLSRFFKRQFAVLGLTILITGVGYYLSKFFLEDRAYLSPFTYLNIGEIANGERGALLDSPYLTVQTGCILLIACSLLFLVCSTVLKLKNRS